MCEEMQGAEGDTGWKKAIPEGRDRLQSQVLVWVVGTLLIAQSILTLSLRYRFFQNDSRFILSMISTSIGFSVLVQVLRAATPAAAVFGGIISLVLIDGSESYGLSILHSGLTPLAFLFLLTFFSTRAGRQAKTRAGLAEERRGRRASQVVANLSAAGLSVSMLGLILVTGSINFFSTGPYWRDWVVPAMKLMCLAALVEATADTVSSEIGQAFGGRPILLLTGRHVEPGTDGAVTFVGSLAGIASGVFVAAVGMWSLRLRPSQAAIAVFAGICGLFFDSFLGATVERRGWLGNDLVNFSSTLFAALLAAAIYRFVSPQMLMLSRMAV
ncbi:MAG: DUF92 domain-containing protein [Edaphobacter sp.]